MANTKDYAMREMIYDQCFGTGREYTREQLMAIVNRKLEDRGMLPIQSRTTFIQDINEMNGKFFKVFGQEGIVWEDRHKKRYYRYRDGFDSIYNRELTENEIEKLQEVRSLLQGFKGMSEFGWIDQMLTRLDQNIMSKQKEIARFEGGTPWDAEFLMPLFKAIRNRQVVDVEYRKDFRDAETIEAYPLICMSAVKANNEVKYKPTKTSFKQYFKHLVGVTVPPETTVEHIELWADISLYPYLYSYPISETQKLEIEGERNIKVSLDVMVNYELIQELMFYGDRLVVKSPAYLRDHMLERLEWCKQSYEQVEGDSLNIENLEPQLFAFNYLHNNEYDWKYIDYRISLGTMVLRDAIEDLSIEWSYIRTCLERIVNHPRTVIELGEDDEPTKIELKKVGEMLDITVTPNSRVSNECLPFNGFARCKDVVRELYKGILEMANAYPTDYVDGCPFTCDVVRRALKSEIIENYLKEE